MAIRVPFRSRANTGDEERGEGRMTLMEHLAELRNRLFIAVAAVIVAGLVGFFLYPQILHFLQEPLREATKGKTCSSGLGDCSKLITTDYLQPFIIRLKIAMYFGILVASPIVLWEIWRFVTPGLNTKERKYALPFVLSTTILFLLGAVVAWFTLPKALSFLIGIGGNSLDVHSTANAYVTLVGLMFLAFGLSFEFPVILVFLLLANVLKTEWLRKYRRHA
ncbi:MAG TPA: twin-arginine translocase subunit TatC, partial [Acidimicrobiia bacterium]